MPSMPKVQCRAIPAFAGEAQARCAVSELATDYPRSRGVSQNGRPPEEKSVGLSPLARGGQVQLPAEQSPQRVIPARAGEPLVPAH